MVRAGEGGERERERGRERERASAPDLGLMRVWELALFACYGGALLKICISSGLTCTYVKTRGLTLEDQVGPPSVQSVNTRVDRCNGQLWNLV